MATASFTPNTTFNQQLGETLKQQGMTQAAEKRSEYLEQARLIAKNIARQNPSRECNADMVVEQLAKVGVHPSELGNAAGSLFKGKEWQFVRFQPSTRASNHARAIRVWRLADSL